MSSRESKSNSRIAGLAYKYAPAALAALHEIITSKSASGAARVAAANIMLTYAGTATGRFDYKKLTSDELDALEVLLRKADTDEFPG
jgi:hypothetical protein